jgi:hypothetical protein
VVKGESAGEEYDDVTSLTNEGYVGSQALKVFYYDVMDA